MAKKVSCIIFGAGGHAKVLIEILSQDANISIKGILENNPSLWNTEFCGFPILGGDDLLPQYAQTVDAFVVAVGSVKATTQRKKLYDWGISCNLRPLSVQHPSTIIAPSARFGLGVQVLAGGIICSYTSIGNNVLLNTGSIVEHDCIVEDHVHIATGAKLAGGVYVGSCSHIGIGASIRQGIKIGEGSVVGAGAVVVKDVPPGVVVVGVPARPI